MESILECRNIVKNYDGTEALKGINLELEEGEILGLLGDNGAGKTTLIKIIRGALKPTRGNVYLKGEEKSFESPRDALSEGIMCVYQDAALILHMSIAENFFMGVEPTKRTGIFSFIDKERMKKETEEYLREMGFDLDVEESIRNFSGGERRAVSILRALYFNPKILLLDEPVIALSEKAKKRLFSVLKDRKGECPMLYVTHDLSNAIALCDRILTLRRGGITGNLTGKEMTVKNILKRI